MEAGAALDMALDEVIAASDGKKGKGRGKGGKRKGKADDGDAVESKAETKIGNKASASSVAALDMSLDDVIDSKKGGWKGGGKDRSKGGWSGDGKGRKGDKSDGDDYAWKEPESKGSGGRKGGNSWSGAAEVKWNTTGTSQGWENKSKGCGKRSGGDSWSAGGSEKDWEPAWKSKPSGADVQWKEKSNDDYAWVDKKQDDSWSWRANGGPAKVKSWEHEDSRRGQGAAWQETSGGDSYARGRPREWEQEEPRRREGKGGGKDGYGYKGAGLKRSRYEESPSIDRYDDMPPQRGRYDDEPPRRGRYDDEPPRRGGYDDEPPRRGRGEALLKRSRYDVEPANSIQVSNIPRDLTTRDIKDAFESEAGKTSSCEMKNGTARVTFLRAADAKRAVDTFDGGELNGHIITVTIIR